MDMFQRRKRRIFLKLKEQGKFKHFNQIDLLTLGQSLIAFHDLLKKISDDSLLSEIFGSELDYTALHVADIIDSIDLILSDDYGYLQKIRMKKDVLSVPK